MTYLQTRAVDDAPEPPDVLISSKLLARAERESAKEKLRTLPKLGKASAKLAAALGVLLEVTGAHDDLAEQAADDGSAVEPVSLAQVQPFLPLLCEVIRFGAAPDGERVLAALRDLPRLWGGGRNKVDRSEIGEQLLIGSRRRLVLHAPELEPGVIDWRA